MDAYLGEGGGVRINLHIQLGFSCNVIFLADKVPKCFMSGIKSSWLSATVDRVSDSVVHNAMCPLVPRLTTSSMFSHSVMTGH